MTASSCDVLHEHSEFVCMVIWL